MTSYTSAPRFSHASSNVPGQQPTDRDMSLIHERMVARSRITEPTEGDFIRLHDGRLARISHCWDDTVQTTKDGSYYMGRSGHCEYSGGLYPGVARDALVATDETQTGMVWFFHHDSAGAHLGVYFYVPMRVWTLKPGTDDKRALGY